MKLRSLLFLGVVPFFLFCALGCGAEEQAKPKIVKGGLEPDKAKTEQNMKMEIMK